MGESIFALDTAYQFYMSLLVKYLEKNKKYDISRLIQKVGFEIHTGYEQGSYEGTYYHKVIVLVDQDIFVNILDEKDSYTQEIKNGIKYIIKTMNLLLILILHHHLVS